MVAEAICSYFNEIDEIQSDVFDTIHQLEHLGSLNLNVGESYEDRRSNLAGAANGAIIKIPDLLLVIEVQLKQLSEKEATDALLPEKLTLYIQNWHHLKLRLKSSLLEAHSIEMDLIHKQRIAEYVKVEETRGTKEDLFAGRSTEKTPEDTEKKVQEQILTQNKNITSSLQLTKQLMTMSVMQTELNIESIDQQSKDLSQLNDKLMDLEGVLTRSRQIVKFIEKQDKRDKKRIYLSIGFLLCCCAWVIWRRVLKTPVRLLMWSFLQFFGVLNWATHRLKPIQADVQEISASSVSQILLTTALQTTQKVQHIVELDIQSQATVADETSPSSLPSETAIASSATSEIANDIKKLPEAFSYIQEEVEDLVWVSETLDPEDDSQSLHGKGDLSTGANTEDANREHYPEPIVVDEGSDQVHAHTSSTEAEQSTTREEVPESGYAQEEENIIQTGNQKEKSEAETVQHNEESAEKTSEIISDNSPSTKIVPEQQFETVDDYSSLGENTQGAEVSPEEKGGDMVFNGNKTKLAGAEFTGASEIEVIENTETLYENLAIQKDTSAPGEPSEDKVETPATLESTKDNEILSESIKSFDSQGSLEVAESIQISLESSVSPENVEIALNSDEASEIVQTAQETDMIVSNANDSYTEHYPEPETVDQDLSSESPEIITPESAVKQSDIEEDLLSNERTHHSRTDEPGSESRESEEAPLDIQEKNEKDEIMIETQISDEESSTRKVGENTPKQTTEKVQSEDNTHEGESSHTTHVLDEL